MKKSQFLYRFPGGYGLVRLLRRFAGQDAPLHGANS